MTLGPVRVMGAGVVVIMCAQALVLKLILAVVQAPRVYPLSLEQHLVLWWLSL